MSINKLVTAADFFEAFEKCWEEEALGADKKTLKSEVSECYPQSTEWTRFMLGDKGSEKPGEMEDAFLHKVKVKLAASRNSLEMARGWHKLDAMFYRGDTLFNSDGYPPILDVLIEHENDDDVEVEMWKLLMFRSPLKVIIFYDWGDNAKKEGNSEKRKKWLPDKLRELTRMAIRVEQLWPENKDTEYLFIVGNRGEKKQICWRKFSLNKLVEEYCRYDFIAGRSDSEGKEKS